MKFTKYLGVTLVTVASCFYSEVIFSDDSAKSTNSIGDGISKFVTAVGDVFAKISETAQGAIEKSAESVKQTSAELPSIPSLPQLPGLPKLPKLPELPEPVKQKLSIISSTANNIYTSIPAEVRSGHAFIQLGGYWSIQGANQHININDLIGDKFTVTKSNGNNGLVGFGYLVDGHSYKNYVHMLYGLNAFYLAKTSISGNVIQENLFTNLAYTYQVTHWPLYAVAKAIITPKYFDHDLTLDVGIGPNFMRLTNFKERPLDPNSLPDTIFSNNTSTKFSATVGVGMKLAKMFENVPLECGYRFYYLGKGNLAKNNSMVLNNLDTGYAYANSIMCSITT